MPWNVHLTCPNSHGDVLIWLKPKKIGCFIIINGLKPISIYILELSLWISSMKCLNELPPALAGE